MVTRRVLADRDLRRVLFSYFAFHIAEFGTWVAILLYAYEATGPASVGVVALIQLVPGRIAAAPAAALGDRYPRHRVRAAGYPFQSVAMLATGAAMLLDGPVLIVYALATIAATAPGRHPPHPVGVAAVAVAYARRPDRRQWRRGHRGGAGCARRPADRGA